MDVTITKNQNGGITVDFSEAPELFYYNENGTGVGKLFLKGEEVKKKVFVDIRAVTNGVNGVEKLRYKIKVLSGKPGETEIIDNKE